MPPRVSFPGKYLQSVPAPNMARFSMSRARSRRPRTGWPHWRSRERGSRYSITCSNCIRCVFQGLGTSAGGNRDQGTSTQEGKEEDGDETEENGKKTEGEKKGKK